MFVDKQTKVNKFPKNEMHDSIYDFILGLYRITTTGVIVYEYGADFSSDKNSAKYSNRSNI